MAVAQSNANFSATQIGHAGQNGQNYNSQYVTSTFENAAWPSYLLNSDGNSAAAEMWYEEKTNYDNNPAWSDNTGHYFNLTNKRSGPTYLEYDITGLGVNSTAPAPYGSYGNKTVVQEYEPSSWGFKGYVEDIDSYQDDFNTYVDMVSELGKQYTITFNSNGGSAVATQTIDSGKFVTKPADPTKAGYKFDGWYSDQNLASKYDFNTPVRANTTLYAKWEKVVITSVAAPDSQTVESGSEPTYPSTVTATYSDGSNGQVAVKWAKLTKEQYGKRAGGKFTVEGTIDGYAEGISFTVTVNSATVKSVANPEAVTVVNGVEPTIPTNAQVTWSNGDTSTENITWEADNDPSKTKFDEVKSYKFTGTVEGEEITWTVTVVEATITAVHNPEDITVKAGDTLDGKLPSIVEVDLSNDQKNQSVPVVWSDLTAADKATLNGRKGGTFTLTGVVNGQKNVIATVTIKVTPATINDTKLGAISTPAGIDPTGKLPKTVDITWSNGDTQKGVTVIWNKIDAAQYAKKGSFTATGSVSVDGVTGKVTQPVTVTDPVAIKAEATQKTVEVIATHAPDLSKIQAKVTYSNGSTETADVVWPDIDSSKYSSAGSFEVTGTVKDVTDADSQPLTIIVTVKVDARAITAVTASADKLTVATVKDTDPQPTVTGKATVTWNDGTIETRDVPLTLPQGWNHPRTAHTVQADGKVDGWNKDVLFTVNVQAATAESAANPADVTTTVKVVPTLPETATVTWSNGETSKELVTWTKPADTAYDKEGPVTVNGTVEGKTVQVIVNVTAATLTKVDSPAGPFEMEAGKAPANLPSTVTAHWSNDTESQIAVTWNTKDVDFANRTGKDKTVTVNGTVQGWEKGVTATVTVHTATVTGAQVDGNTTVATESGTAPKLPENAKVTWSDGGADSTEAITWDKFDSYKDRKGGTFTVNGTVHGQAVQATVTVTPATPVKLHSDQFEASTTVDTKPELPASAKVVWSNGDETEESIAWDAYDDALLNKEGSFTVTGKVTVPSDASGEATETKTFDVTTTVTVKKAPSKPDQNPTKPGQTKPGQNQNTSNKGTAGNSQQQLSNTGSSVLIIAVVVVVLAAIAGVMLVIKRKKQ